MYKSIELSKIFRLIRVHGRRVGVKITGGKKKMLLFNKKQLFEAHGSIHIVNRHRHVNIHQKKEQ